MAIAGTLVCVGGTAVVPLVSDSPNGEQQIRQLMVKYENDKQQFLRIINKLVLASENFNTDLEHQKEMNLILSERISLIENEKEILRQINSIQQKEIQGLSERVKQAEHDHQNLSQRILSMDAELREFENDNLVEKQNQREQLSENQLALQRARLELERATVQAQLMALDTEKSQGQIVTASMAALGGGALGTLFGPVGMTVGMLGGAGLGSAVGTNKAEEQQRQRKRELELAIHRISQRLIALPLQ